MKRSKALRLPAPKAYWSFGQVLGYLLRTNDHANIEQQDSDEIDQVFDNFEFENDDPDFPENQ